MSRKIDEDIPYPILSSQYGIWTINPSEGHLVLEGGLPVGVCCR